MKRFLLIFFLSVTIQNIVTQTQDNKVDSRLDNDENSSSQLTDSGIQEIKEISSQSETEASNINTINDLNDGKIIQDNTHNIPNNDGKSIKIKNGSKISEATPVSRTADIQTAPTGPRNNLNDFEINNEDETNLAKQRTIVDRVIPLKALLQLLNTKNRLLSGLAKTIEGNRRIIEGVKDSSGALIGFAKDSANNIFDIIPIPWS